MPRLRYGTNAIFRSRCHDLVNARIDHACTTYYEPLPSPTITAHIRITEDEVHLVLEHKNGQEEQFHLETIRDMPLYDKVFSAWWLAVLDPDQIEIYKKLSRALDHREFRLRGPFDCANRYITDGHYDTDCLPEIEATDVFPYYLTDESQIRGEIVFTKWCNERRIYLINVKSEAEGAMLLRDQIPVDTVVYLGGDHHETALDCHTAPTAKTTKWASQSPEISSSAGGTIPQAMASSPFCQTRGVRRIGCASMGPNVGICKGKGGGFAYWSTDSEPEAGVPVSLLHVTEIPKKGFPGGAGFMLADDIPLGDAFDGAWIMKGDRLFDKVPPEKSLDHDVLARPTSRRIFSS